MAIIKLKTIAPKFLLSEIESSDTENCIPCIFNSQEVTIIRQALFPVSSWKTRLGENIGGDLFEYTEDEATKTEFKNVVSLIDYKLSGGDLMDCFESIGDGLQAIADALRVRCCDNDISDITVNVTPGGNTVTGDITQGVPGEGEGEVPEGFEDWTAYYLHKCQAANAIVDGFINNLNVFSIISTVNFVTVSAALAVFLTMSFPPAGIAFVLLALTALVEARIHLASLSDYIATNRDDFVCAIYNSPTAGDAIDAFLGFIDEGIESLSLEVPLPSQVRQVINALCDANVFAQVYNAAFEIFYPDADCSDCSAYVGNCDIESKDTYWPMVVTKVSDTEFDIELGNIGSNWGNSFGPKTGQCTLNSLTVTNSGTFDHYYLSLYTCVDGEAVETTYNDTRNGLAWLNSLMPIEGFLSLWFGYQTESLDFTVVTADDCEFCGAGDSEAMSREISDIQYFIDDYVKKNDKVPSKEDIAKFRETRDA